MYLNAELQANYWIEERWNGLTDDGVQSNLYTKNKVFPLVYFDTLVHAMFSYSVIIFEAFTS